MSCKQQKRKRSETQETVNSNRIQQITQVELLQRVRACSRVHLTPSEKVFASERSIHAMCHHEKTRPQVTPDTDERCDPTERFRCGGRDARVADIPCGIALASSVDLVTKS